MLQINPQCSPEERGTHRVRQRLLSTFLVFLEILLALIGVSELQQKGVAQTNSDRQFQLLEAQHSQNATQADRRVALVLGNSQYPVSPLNNPRNDANDMSKALEGLGFDRVIVVLDADLATMENALEAFYQELQQGGVGVFYYAGHGVQSNGENYLIPVDATIELEADLNYDALPLGKVLNRMEAAANRLNIIILDACRNNPFARSWRSQSRGLASVNAPGGTFIAYSTSPGDVAADGRGRNSPFTAAILRHIDQPIPIQTLFINVRVDVLSVTNNLQTPWDSSSLTEEFHFRKPPVPSESPPVSSPEAIEAPVLTATESNQPPLEPSANPVQFLQFYSVPRLSYIGTSHDRAGARGATYYFTFEFPASEGASLASLKLEQTSGTPVLLQPEAIEVFQGTRRDRREVIAFSLESASEEDAREAFTLHFSPPIPPGQTFTVAVPPRSNPAQDGTIVYTFTAFPLGSEERGIPLGVGQLSFYDVNSL